jgi:hypothetical protein
MVRMRGVPAAALPIVILFSACAPAALPPSAASGTAPLPASPSPSLSASPSATTTDTPAPTPTPTIALPDYPHLILPGIDRLRSLIAAGRNQSLRSGVFSKVGDSLTANGIFLAPFGAGAYTLGEFGYLQEVIDFFSREEARAGNSFVNPSLAAKSGWRAEDVLDPARAPSPCDARESPLDCEFRVVRPAIAVILLGTNDAAAPTGSYEQSMERIIARAVAAGILPVLTTLPEMVNRDTGAYSEFVRDLAGRWDLPLIDLAAALEPLPRHGLGPDGIHLSWVEPAVFEPQYLQDGMTMRNLLTLQMLDALWKAYPLEG